MRLNAPLGGRDVVDGSTGQSIPEMPRTPLAVQPLSPDRFADLAALFEEGGDPKWCWCTFFRFRGRDWSNSTAAENRAALEHLAERDDLAPGLVGYRDGRAVGWVSLGPREDYERLTASKILAPVDDTPVWSIVCFVVSRDARGQGVASGLLAAAIEYARAHGATTLEAYPVDSDRGRVPPRTPSAARCRSSSVPASRSSNADSGTTRHRSARSSGWLSEASDRVGNDAAADVEPPPRAARYVIRRDTASSSVRVDTRFASAGRLPTGSHVAGTDPLSRRRLE